MSVNWEQILHEVNAKRLASNKPTFTSVDKMLVAVYRIAGSLREAGAYCSVSYTTFANKLREKGLLVGSRGGRNNFIDLNEGQFGFSSERLFLKHIMLRGKSIHAGFTYAEISRILRAVGVPASVQVVRNRAKALGLARHKGRSHGVLSTVEVAQRTAAVEAIISSLVKRRIEVRRKAR